MSPNVFDMGNVGFIVFRFLLFRQANEGERYYGEYRKI